MTRTDLAPVPVEQLDDTFVGLYLELRIVDVVFVAGGISDVTRCDGPRPHTHVWVAGRHLCLDHPRADVMPFIALYVEHPTDPATGQPIAEESTDAHEPAPRPEAPAPDDVPRAVGSGVAGADPVPDGPSPRAVDGAPRPTLDRARRRGRHAVSAFRAVAMKAGPALAAVFAGFLMAWGVHVALAGVPASGDTITAALLIVAAGGIATRLVSVAQARRARSAVTR